MSHLVPHHSRVNPYLNPQQIASGGGLPFQQINTRYDNDNSALLLQQRENERNQFDMARGVNLQPGARPPMFRPPQPSNLPIPRVGLLKGMSNAHPALIQQFMSLNPYQQHQFAATHPYEYAQIYKSIQDQSMAYQQQQMQQQQQQYQQQNSSDESSSGLSSSDQDSEPSTNYHSSDVDGHLNGSGSEEGDGGNDKKRKKKRRKTKKISRKKKIHQFDTSQEDKCVKASRSKIDTGRRSIYLPIDFRNNLCGIDGSKSRYIVDFPSRHNVYGIELESCIIESLNVLENEPYIYLLIDEIDGDYLITGTETDTSVFGKLVLDKNINSFIYYKPENCVKRFDSPQKLDQLSISFLKYDHEPISLGKIPIGEIRKGRNYMKVVSKFPHHLTSGDKINMCYTDHDSIIIDNLDVLAASNSHTVSIELPESLTSSSVSIEKIAIKCTLTFKIYC
jgi:hypothetical protein